MTITIIKNNKKVNEIKINKKQFVTYIKKVNSILI